MGVLKSYFERVRGGISRKTRLLALVEKVASIKTLILNFIKKKD